MVGGKIAVAAVCAVALCSAVAPAAGAPALTTIEDRLYKADGSAFSGVLYIEWRSFDTSGREPLPAASVTAHVTSGLLRTVLAPTTTAVPRAYYRVRYTSNGLTDFIEYWSVPPSSSKLRVADIRIPGPLSVSEVPVPPINTAILIADVSGLRDELDSRPSKASAFVPGRAAIINTDGDIESASGAATDCVHVDGSSGPCGGGGGVAFVDAETPSGVVDGSNATFTLTAAPVPLAALKLFRNGLLLRGNVDYLITGQTITLQQGAIPQSGDILAAYYRYPELSAGAVTFADDETPVGLRDGANAEFRLQAAPLPAASLQVFRNGILLKAGLDYHLTENVLTFMSGSVPTADDELSASYRY